jgi:hypothetical protein
MKNLCYLPHISNMQSQQEKIFFGFILQNPHYFKFINDRFFESNEYKLLFPVVKDFHGRYNQAPSRHQVWQVIQTNNELMLKIDEEKLKIIYEFSIGEYDPTWLKETFEAWVEFKNLEISLFDTIQYVKTTKVTPDNIKDTVNNVKALMIERNSIDFGYDIGLDFFDTGNHFEEVGNYFTSGKNYIDQVLGGGFYKKALFVFAAPPKTGKCCIYSTKIKIRNKKTGLIEEIEIGKFQERIKNA